VRWLTLSSPGGKGLMVIASDLLHIDALHYSTQDLAAARHPHELTRLDWVILHLDGWHMGLGGDTGWTANVHPEFLIQPGDYCFSFRMRPVNESDDPAVLARTKPGFAAELAD
jgi:beta-galactosidase